MKKSKSTSPFLRADKIKQAPVSWLLPKFIAYGHLSLIAGDPGVGKSHLVVDLIARLSRGLKIPGQAGKKFGRQAALLVSLEDAEGNTALRLAAAKAGMKKVRVFNRDAVPAEPSVQKFLGFLEGVLVSDTNARLVVVDTIAAVCELFGNKKNALAELMFGLSRLAADYSVAIVGVTHLTKSAQPGRVANVLGSIKVNAGVRAVLQLSRSYDGHHCFLWPLKNNLGTDKQGLRFRIADVHGAKGRSVSKIFWTKGLMDVARIKAAIAAPSALSSAVKKIKPVLKGRRSIPSKMLEREAKRLGLSPATAKAAAEQLGYESKRVNGAAAKGSWDMVNKNIPAENATKKDAPFSRRREFGRGSSEDHAKPGKQKKREEVKRGLKKAASSDDSDW